MGSLGEDDKYTKDGTVDLNGHPAIKAKTGNIRTCPYILGNECCERLAFFGLGTNLVNYMKGRLNMASTTAANSVTNWSGTCYIMPLLGAFVADAYLGRFYTIASFMMLYIFGLTLLTMSASVKGLKPSCTNGTCHASSGQTAVFFVSLYVIALATGGVKPCISAFGADQFDDNDEAEKKIISSFFNWFYFSIMAGALVAVSGLVWIQTNVGWGWGFGIPAACMAVAVVCFFLGTRLYRHQKPGGSPLSRIAQVLVAAVRKARVKLPDNKSHLYEVGEKESAILGSRKLEHTSQFSFLDKAAVQTDDDDLTKGPVSPWKLCTVTQVEELKALVRLFPIWTTGIIYSTVYVQITTMFILQGNTLDQSMGPHFKIPSASLTTFDILTVMLWAALYDLAIVPFVRKITGQPRGFTQLTRIGIGLVISVFAMLAAAILEVVRLNIVKRHNLYDAKTVPLSIFWQVPQYFFIGCSEVFTFIGFLEFFYDQAPDAMRSICSALSLTTFGAGNYLSTLIVTIVVKVTTRDGKLGWLPDNLNLGHLDYYFYLLAVLSAANFVVYLLIAQWYTYKKIADGEVVDRSLVEPLAVPPSRGMPQLDRYQQ